MTPEDSPFTLRHLEEPEIQFEGGTETSPKRGLIRYGPRLYEEGHHTIKLGIIGDRDSIRRLTELLHDMEVGIHPGTSDKPWQVPYPGRVRVPRSISLLMQKRAGDARFVDETSNQLRVNQPPESGWSDS